MKLFSNSYDLKKTHTYKIFSSSGNCLQVTFKRENVAAASHSYLINSNVYQVYNAI